MLRIEHLYKKYGRFEALKGLNMEVKKGEIYGFVGPNGAGKTTTIRIIAGLLAFQSGEIWVDGLKTNGNYTRLKSMMGFVPDFFGVYENLKVTEYLEFFAAAYGIYGKQGHARSLEVLDLVGLTGVEDRFVDALSKGMQQRLCLARALIHNPRLLVLDEPCAGLDPRTRREFQHLLQRLQKQGYTVLISSHILSELADLSTSIGIIDRGKMIIQGEVDSIMLSIDSANPIRISVLKNLQTAVELLRRNPLITRMSIENNKIAVWFEGSAEEEALLLKELMDAGILVTSFAREHNSLESLFFRMTEPGEEREDSGAKPAGGEEV